ncbi:MAG: hypothetical protein ABI353_16840 [Isosphaeraceae bacterium]
MSKHFELQRVVLALVLACLAAKGPDDRARVAKPSEGLAMTRALACESIKGYQDYVPRPEAALTKDEKLLVYYEPLNYAIEQDKTGMYRAHFSQDARIRKRGAKIVLWKKDNLLDYEVKGNGPPRKLCLMNTIALKALSPGEYDLDIVLHDRLGDGPPVTQTLKITIKPSPVEAPLPPSDEPGNR